MEEEEKQRHFIVVPYPHTNKPWFDKFFGSLIAISVILAANKLLN